MEKKIDFYLSGENFLLPRATEVAAIKKIMYFCNINKKRRVDDFFQFNILKKILVIEINQEILMFFSDITTQYLKTKRKITEFTDEEMIELNLLTF